MTVVDPDSIDTTPIAYGREAAALAAGISVAQVDREIKAGRLVARRCGRRRIIRRADLEAWLDALEVAS